jgi:hypothetical protein
LGAVERKQDRVIVDSRVQVDRPAPQTLQALECFDGVLDVQIDAVVAVAQI